MCGLIYLKVCWKQQTNCFDYPLSKEKSLWNAVCVCVCVCVCVFMCAPVSLHLAAFYEYAGRMCVPSLSQGFCRCGTLASFDLLMYETSDLSHTNTDTHSLTHTHTQKMNTLK